jgi:hypothetical protein
MSLNSCVGWIGVAGPAEGGERFSGICESPRNQFINSAIRVF